MKRLRNHSGFSIIEMVLSMLMVIIISAVSYRVLKSQTFQQMTNMESQKNNRSMQVALGRFKTDADMMDPNWFRYGLRTIWPEQGHGFGQNYYLLSPDQKNEISIVNDGVTFLRRNPQTDRIYVPYTTKKRLCDPSPIIANEDQNLFDVNISLDSISNLEVGQWMLMYQAGHYALGVISVVNQPSISPSSPGATSRFISTSNSGSGGSEVVASGGSIQLRKPNASERQTTSLNSANMSNGFVTKSGVIASSYDMFGNVTSDAADNSFCFDVSKITIQKIAAPVSYFADYRTNDGKSKLSSNAYVLDSQGKKIRMLVRAEYVDGVQKREYITPIDEVGFTYDLINPEATDDEDRIARNVGRMKGSNFLLNLGSANPSQANADFLNSYRIVSVKIGIGMTVKDSQKSVDQWKQTKEMKVALDPSVQQDAYQEDATLISSLTDSLKLLPKSSSGIINEQIGKPTYLVTTGKNEVVVPSSTFEVLTDGSLGPQSSGALYVYDTSGCAVNSSSSNCAPTDNSAIQFNLGAGTTFFPNTVSQVELPNGDRRILVGGVAMSVTGGATFRKPGLGIITLGPDESLQEKLSDTSGASGCNISNCSWQPINPSGENVDLLDTAHVSVDPINSNNIYVAPMTKSTGKGSQSNIYKGVWNGTSYSYTKFASVVGTEEGKVVTAISNHPIRIFDQEYIVACLSKNMSSSCNGDCLKPQNETSTNAENGIGGVVNENDEAVNVGDELAPTPSVRSQAEMYGEIQLISQGNSAVLPGFVLKRHNYRCSSIDVTENQDLIVSGRLTAQPISIQEIKQIVSAGSRRPPTVLTETSSTSEILAANLAASHTPMLYLDEVVGESGGQTFYADYYQVDPETYENPSNPQYVGWLTGMSTVEFADGTFGIVNANKYRLDAHFGINTNSIPMEYSNAGISKVRLAGMNDRVVATIQTDPSNINNSMITAVYSARSHELPSVYIPGTFYTQPGKPRTSPTPLPSMSPALNEKSWIQLYQALLTPRDVSGLNSNMPILGALAAPVTDCTSTKPKTCH